MKLLVIGANGQIGKMAVDKIRKNTPHTPIAMIRNEQQVEQFHKVNVETVIADLEGDFEHAVKGKDGIVFTAGSGGHTGADKTERVDREGALKSIDYAKKHNVQRYIMVSTLGIGLGPDKWPASMDHYFRAKAAADEYLIQSGLTYTIIRPGRLTNESPKNKIELKEGSGSITHAGDITRSDVAQLVVKCLDADNTNLKILPVLQGEEQLEEAVATL